MTTDPLGSFSQDELKSYAHALITQALQRLELNEADCVEAACWRLADALGALSSLVVDDTMGIHHPTGLGYMLRIANEPLEEENDKE